MSDAQLALCLSTNPFVFSPLRFESEDLEDNGRISRIVSECTPLTQEKKPGYIAESCKALLSRLDEGHD